ncbi:MAG TPA: hypothetical protein VNL71_23330, partial [Chloroflexota bacterium]|nr:hypothetical protein [Chloroflexota bacterium]
ELDAIKARQARGWAVRPEDLDALVAEVEKLREALVYIVHSDPQVALHIAESALAALVAK